MKRKKVNPYTVRIVRKKLAELEIRSNAAVARLLNLKAGWSVSKWEPDQIIPPAHQIMLHAKFPHIFPAPVPR